MIIALLLCILLLYILQKLQKHQSFKNLSILKIVLKKENGKNTPLGQNGEVIRRDNEKAAL